MILLCLTLLFALTLTVSAAGSSVALTASDSSVQNGETFTVEAVLDNSQAISIGTVALSFDERVFTLTGGTSHVEGAMIGQVIPDKKAGTFLIALPKKLSGKIFTFEFLVKDSAPQGTYEIAAKAAIGTTGGNYIDVKGIQITVGGTQAPSIDPTQQTPDEPEKTPTETQSSTQATTLPAQTEDTVETTIPTDNPSPKNFANGWIVAVLLLLAAGGVTGFLIFKRRRK